MIYSYVFIGWLALIIVFLFIIKSHINRVADFLGSDQGIKKFWQMIHTENTTIKTYLAEQIAVIALTAGILIGSIIMLALAIFYITYFRF